MSRSFYKFKESHNGVFSIWKIIGKRKMKPYCSIFHGLSLKFWYNRINFQAKEEMRNANRAHKKRTRQYLKRDIKQQVSDYYLEDDMTIKPFPNKYINYVDFTDASIKTERLSLKWVESDSALTAETSFGRAHISKKYKEAMIYSPTGNRRIYSDIKDINKLKQKVQDQHDIQVSQVLNLWVSSSIKLKG